MSQQLIHYCRTLPIDSNSIKDSKNKGPAPAQPEVLIWNCQNDWPLQLMMNCLFTGLLSHLSDPFSDNSGLKQPTALVHWYGMIPNTAAKPHLHTEILSVLPNLFEIRCSPVLVVAASLCLLRTLGCSTTKSNRSELPLRVTRELNVPTFKATHFSTFFECSVIQMSWYHGHLNWV